MDLLQWGMTAFGVTAVVLTLVWLRRKEVESRRLELGLVSVGPGRSPEDVLLSIEAEERWARSENMRLSRLLTKVRMPRYEDMLPAQLLGLAERHEIDLLQKITDSDSRKPSELIDALRSKGSNGLAQFWRALTRNIDEIDVPYEELLSDAANDLGVKQLRQGSIHAIEMQLQQRAFEKMVAGMPKADQQRFLKAFAAQSKEPSLGKEAMLGGGIVLANLSGFGVYLASSTVLGGITAAMGLTLPFAAYTGMSSALAVVIGPVGWVALGVWVAHKLGKADPKKVVAGVLLVANVRQRLISVRDEPIPQIRHDRDVVLKAFERGLAEVRTKLVRAIRYRSTPSDRVAPDLYALPARPRLYLE